MRLKGTKKALTERMREIVHNAKLGLPLEGRDAVDALSVLRRHPDWKDKRGRSLDYICVRINTGAYGKTKGFWVKRHDGVLIDVSWVYALRNSTHEKNVKLSARAIIAEHTKSFRKSRFIDGEVIECEACKKRTPARWSEVHHVSEFASIFDEWLLSESISTRDIELVHHDASHSDKFKDEELAERWKSWHERFAVLQLLCNACHKRVTHK